MQFMDNRVRELPQQCAHGAGLIRINPGNSQLNLNSAEDYSFCGAVPCFMTLLLSAAAQSTRRIFPLGRRVRYGVDANSLYFMKLARRRPPCGDCSMIPSLKVSKAGPLIRPQKECHEWWRRRPCF